MVVSKRVFSKDGTVRRFVWAISGSRSFYSWCWVGSYRLFHLGDRGGL